MSFVGSKSLQIPREYTLLRAWVLAPPLLFFYADFFEGKVLEENLWKKKQRRIAEEEEYDRDDRWYRDFSVRAESWVAIESWAHEHDFHLVAIKGKKRLYRRGYEPNYYQTFIEIRHEPNRIVMRGWIEVGFRLRAISVFQLPRELPIWPYGFWGIRIRRRACRDFNNLLERLKQPDIAGSNEFHFLDLDATTLALIGFLPLPSLVFVGMTLLRMELGAGLTNGLLMTLGEKFVWLAGSAITLLLLHHQVIVKMVPKLWPKITSASVIAIGFLIASIFLITQTRSEMLDQRVTYHCVSHFQAERCQKSLEAVPPKQMAGFVERIESLQKFLATRKQ